MLNEENAVINLEDLTQADSLMDYLDEDKALVLGAHFDQAQDYPGFSKKFGNEINSMFNRIKDMQENLATIQDAMSPDDTLMEFIDKGVNAYEDKKDRITAAFLMGMYVADCAAKMESANE